MRGILLDETNNLLIQNKTLAIGDTLFQNQKLIIGAHKGEIKENPLLGVGITNFIDDEEPSELLREVRINLRMDGQKVKKSLFENGKLIIESKYD